MRYNISDTVLKIYEYTRYMPKDVSTKKLNEQSHVYILNGFTHPLGWLAAVCLERRGRPIYKLTIVL